MPKRANPFDSHYSPLQMKMHVTQREVNMGVNKEANMKAVYDRTRELLYNGQKSCNPVPQEVEMEESRETPSESICQNGAASATPSPPSWPHNQLRLGMGGQLVYGSHAQKTEPKQVSKVMCNTCQNPNMPVHFVCGHCEKNLCYGCRQICVNCEGGYCSYCSTVNYDERSDRIFCLNCS